jgi:hypothetical protein
MDSAAGVMVLVSVPPETAGFETLKYKENNCDVIPVVIFLTLTVQAVCVVEFRNGGRTNVTCVFDKFSMLPLMLKSADPEGLS